MFGLGLSIKNGFKGWANIYLGNENYWNHILWLVVGPAMVLSIVALLVWLRLRRIQQGIKDDTFPHAYRLIWLVLLLQNIIAQLVTGPLTSWNEAAFSIYYLLLFLISAVIVHHFHCAARLASTVSATKEV
jgi:hypothetical protein